MSWDLQVSCHLVKLLSTKSSERLVGAYVYAQLGTIVCFHKLML